MRCIPWHPILSSLDTPTRIFYSAFRRRSVQLPCCVCLQTPRSIRDKQKAAVAAANAAAAAQDDQGGGGSSDDDDDADMDEEDGEDVVAAYERRPRGVEKVRRLACSKAADPDAMRAP